MSREINRREPKTQVTAWGGNVVLDTGDSKIELTPDEAHKLAAQLNKTANALWFKQYKTD